MTLVRPLPGPGRTRQRPILVLVCGERARGDDAAGSVAVDGLAPDALRLVEIRRTGGLDVDAFLLAPPDAAFVLVDAAIGIPPGEVVVMPLAELCSISGDHSAAGRGAPRSSHELPVDQVVGMASMLRGDPPDGSFVGIGAATSLLGAPLSAAVASALPAFRAAIETEIRRLAEPVA